MTSADWDFPDWITGLLDRYSASWEKDRPESSWTAGDLYNTTAMFLAEHPERWKGRNPESSRDLTFVQRTIWGHMRDRIKFDKFDGVGSTTSYETDDGESISSPEAHAVVKGNPLARRTPLPDHNDIKDGRMVYHTYCITYDAPEVQALIPGIWSTDISLYGVTSELEGPAPDMPKGSGPNPAHGNTTAAKVADVQRAWRETDLSDMERKVIVLHYGLEWTQSVVAHNLGVDRATVARYAHSGILKMLTFLNGWLIETVEDAEAV